MSDKRAARRAWWAANKDHQNEKARERYANITPAQRKAKRVRDRATKERARRVAGADELPIRARDRWVDEQGRVRYRRNGRWKMRNGYIYVRLPDGGRVYEHRQVMERHLGRALFPKETVHHINGVRDDNRLENLELWSSSHPSGQRVEDKLKWAREIIALYGDAK